MKGRIFGSLIVAFALLGSTYAELVPSAQVQIQRGFGPVAPAGSGGASMGLSGVLTVSTTQAATTAVTTEETLWTYDLPANTLSADNYGVRITAWGSFAANGNNKTVTVYFGGTTVGSELRGMNGLGFHVVADVFRTGATAQVGQAFITMGTVATAKAAVTPAEDTTGAITLRVTGTNGTANANDIVFRHARVEFLRAGS